MCSNVHMMVMSMHPSIHPSISASQPIPLYREFCVDMTGIAVRQTEATGER